MAGWSDELKARLPEIVLSILAAKQGGPQALGAFQGGVQRSRTQQQAMALQQQERADVLARQAQMDDERRSQQQIENERANETTRRADEAAKRQSLQQAIASMDRYGVGLADTATDPVAAENSLLSRGAGLESAFGLPQGQLSAFVPNMAPPISKRLQTVAKQTYEQAEKIYGPEAMANDSITITTEAFGPVKPSELRAKFGMQAQAATGEAAKPFVSTPTSLVPNTPEEQFYQRFATENGAQTFEALSTKLQAAARKQWTEAGRQGEAEGEAVPLSGQGLDMAAKMYALTGQLPPMGMGRSGAAVRGHIINRAAQYDATAGTFTGTTPPDIATNKANYQANSQALTQITRNLNAVEAFEATAQRNSKLLEDLLGRLPGQTSTTILNRPIRSIAGMVGSEDIAAFNTLRLSLQNEYARLITQPNLAGILTDSARREMEEVLSPNATVGQIRRTLQTLRTEAANRREAFSAQRDSIRQELSQGATTPAAEPVAEEWVRDANGKLVKKTR